MKDENVIRITKFLLDFMYFAGMAVTASLIWLVKWIADFFNYKPFIHNRTFAEKEIGITDVT